MPRATGYISNPGTQVVYEDRYNELDLWVSQSVDGRWLDDDGRVFTLSTLAFVPPQGGATNAAVTRIGFEKNKLKIGKKDKLSRHAAIATLSPIEITAKGRPARQLPRNYKDVDYYEGTNQSVIVCAFLLEKEEFYRLATWELVEGDEYDESLKLFEEKFLEVVGKKGTLASIGASGDGAPILSGGSEADLLRRDAHHSIAAYEGYRATDADEFVVLDDLPHNSDFIVTLTNDLKKMRSLYAQTVPTGLNASNSLAVARIFANREEYLEALGINDATNMNWSAAYWSVERRELVAHLDEGGEEELLNTIRHEAFHQYLSYATSFLPVSPWLNEGYAQYFQGRTTPEWTPETRKGLKKYLPALLAMDYETFYSGTDEERRLKYDLALSLAQFLEQKAPEIRFQPFKNVKHDYFKELFASRDMLRATWKAIGGDEGLKKLLSEW